MEPILKSPTGLATNACVLLSESAANAYSRVLSARNRGFVAARSVIAWLKSHGPEFANAFEREQVIRAAIDQSHVRHDARIGHAREIAFFPPVTGG